MLRAQRRERECGGAFCMSDGARCFPEEYGKEIQVWRSLREMILG